MGNILQIKNYNITFYNRSNLNNINLVKSLAYIFKYYFENIWEVGSRPLKKVGCLFSVFTYASSN